MKRGHPSALPTLALLLFSGQNGALAAVQQIVVPTSLEQVEGNFNNVFPFAIRAFGLPSQRYQQVYAASEFSTAGGPIRITEIAFRPDADFGGPFSEILAGVQINLSTTQKAPDGFSLQFASNAGPDETVVYNGPLSLQSSFTGSSVGPKDFDIRIVLQTPFLYDPAQGNLLLEVRNYNGGVLDLPFDAHSAFGDPTSRLFSFNGPDPVFEHTGISDGVFSVGLITRFSYETSGGGIPVAFDLKPQGCPNPWNVRAGGVIPTAILGGPTVDVAHIDPDSVRLVGVPAMLSSSEDVGTPYEPFTGKTGAAACSADGPDGFRDLILHFSSAALWSAVKTALGREPHDGEVLVLRVTGNLRSTYGGTAIYGEDVALVLKKGKR